MRSLSRITSCLLLVGVGCSVDELDLEGRECPCIDGWVCGPANLCVRAATPDSGAGDVDAGETSGMDAGLDAGAPVDAGDVTGMDADTTPDAGAPDAGPTPSSCDDVHTGVLFCDGFEATDFSAWDGMRTPGGAMATRVTDVVYRGDAALRAEAVPGTSGGAGMYKAVFPIGSAAEQWFRAYWYIPSSPGLNLELGLMFEASGADDWVFNVSGSGINYHSHSLPSSSFRDSDSMVFPTDRWVCVEAHVRIEDPSGGMTELFIEDTRVLARTGVDTTTGRGLGTIFAGISWKDPANTRVLYVDEVVADDERVGCD